MDNSLDTTMVVAHGSKAKEKPLSPGVDGYENTHLSGGQPELNKIPAGEIEVNRGIFWSNFGATRGAWRGEDWKNEYSVKYQQIDFIEIKQQK